MIIFPAIDVKGGECVRLYRGDFATAERVASDYMQTARSFRTAGCSWIHMVDLDGALAGKRVNAPIFLRVAKESGLRVELGGGIRSLEDIAFYLESGVERVILGSVAIQKPALVREAIAAFGGAHVAVGIDARDGVAAADGWLKSGGVHYITLARQMEQAGVQTLIFTDIGRDGMLSGPNLEQLAALRAAVGCDIIASGGVTNIGDIRALRTAGMHGVICGRSLYAGTLDLTEALAAADESGEATAQ
ncbi:MAG: 1-(5-phosphoribosyl)-5-[(5-phosphoribosylamino)methylideneamino]imidazole-4-carboxamide isomerase [Oscillospiraceae bacterium]|jgi:phosphoribosylformimino-5-aminoimidazole carboxamide ribotide isomerase|nr:1-(5-phosphoribosyl)-5-[(5-phosphoribosylamino)methylideneamino]imidazole-4-carboxamide isomerase [Oscillospiraceae bacterium]